MNVEVMRLLAGIKDRASAHLFNFLFGSRHIHSSNHPPDPTPGDKALPIELGCWQLMAEPTERCT